MQITKRYMNLPIENKLKTQRLKILMNDNLFRDFDIQLAQTEPDFWVFIDLKEHLGKTLVLQPEKSNREGLNKIYFSDRIHGADTLYKEQLRPQFHFTSKRGWLNDPNGLVFHNGEYHLYYQHNPYGWNWGNMHWGHAVSKDLVHWEEISKAIVPTYDDMAFSGSAVVDKNNMAGFGTSDQTAIVAAYTSTGRGECIAYSLDNGRTFTDYAENPVLAHEGRDPKIFWYAPKKHWVMVVYDESVEKRPLNQIVKDRTLQVHTSKDLKKWTYRSELDGYYECPELFELAVDGDENNKKWVIYGANGQYRLGSFDGETFLPETPKYEMLHGNAYASQTFNNIPDGRRIQISWGRRIISEGMPFNQMMTFPVELSLSTTAEGVRLLTNPIDEIKTLYGKKQEWKSKIITKNGSFDTKTKNDALHILANFEIMDDFAFGLKINGYELVYDVHNFKLNEVFVRPVDGKITLEILVDKTSIEIFANNGETYMVKPHVSKSENFQVIAYSSSPNFETDSKTLLRELVITELNSIWKPTNLSGEH
ncbi:glycoside hydrolase family 32 protein [Maribacter sp. 2210JD10-5]|uniref:glycoside hydrolase family 32 protein n=1 Tax=Maribacter sp. 2210JD10-5 TaxID=3386272 RepID=UPI0039BCAE65